MYDKCQKTGAKADLLEAHGLSNKTIPETLVEACKRAPHKITLRVKEYGIYRNVTRGEYLDCVESLTLGFVELGLIRGDRVAIMADSCPEWGYSDLAIQAGGAISLGVYSTSSIAEIKYLMKDSGAKFFIAGGQEFLDKFLTAADELREVKKVVVFDTKGLFMYDDPRIITLEKVMELGREKKKKEPRLFEELVGKTRSDDVATIIYTSGTTGPPKGAMMTHRSMLFCACCSLESFPEILGDESTKTVSFLPPMHAMGRCFDIYLPIIGGYKVHFGEDPEAMQETSIEVSPSLFIGVPRTYQKLASQILTGIETSSGIKKIACRLAIVIARRYMKERRRGRPSLLLTFLYQAARQCVFLPILDHVGMKKVKLAIIAAAPVPTPVVTLWQMWGINLKEGFGQTEAGLISVQRADFPVPGNAGQPYPGVRVYVLEDNEIIVKSPANFAGYWQNPKATAEITTQRGISTGDVVEISAEGEIKVVERKKDILVTAGGKNITPSEIEKALKGNPYTSEAIVFGDGRKYPVALIEIDFDSTAEWARQQGIVYTTYTSLASNPRVYELIAKEVEKANSQLARVEQVKKFRILPKELDPEDEADPVTATRKVQRKKTYEKFKGLIDQMYSREEEDMIEAQIGGEQ